MGPHRAPLGDFERVLETRNIELRREIIEKEYGGYEAFFRWIPHQVLDESEEGTLRSISLPSSLRSFFNFFSRPVRRFTVLEVKDATCPEKHYFIPVHPSMKTVRTARAWTFGMAPEEFHPLVET